MFKVLNDIKIFLKNYFWGWKEYLFYLLMLILLFVVLIFGVLFVIL